MNLAQKLVGERIPTNQPKGQVKLNIPIPKVNAKKKVKHAND